MNIWILSVAFITSAAFVAHVVVGTKETATVAPASADDRLTMNWVQAMCAFQMLSVDILVVAAALFAVALFDFGPIERPIVLLLSLLFLAWGLVWLVQLRWLNKPAASLLRLPHWIVWFLCAGLLYLGS
ncbi:MAG: hypothetical protein AAFX92_07150 [Pseudomonadota bacterium]